METMLLKPAGKDYIWGGNRLKQEYGKQIKLTPLAETWECSVHPDGPSIVDSGKMKGRLLKEVLDEFPEFLGKKAGVIGKLPILVKLIDAEKDLSVQVHPNDKYAREHEHQSGKTEVWYVLDANPGASIVCGFAHDVTREKLKQAVDTEQLSKHLQRVSVHKGDVFYIPSGTIHAIGAGVLIAEVQESSNVTYRVYDYNRVDKNGEKRELNFEKALEVLNMKSGTNIRQRPRMVQYYPGCSREMLCRCKYFEIERIEVSMGVSFSVLEESFHVLLCIDGAGGLEAPGMERPLRFSKGNCIFIPANMGRCHVLGKTTLLKVRC